MAVKRSYSRYFIIFQEEDRGFEISIDKQPTGYMKIETRNGKCKITVYVQNLKKDKGPYICYMLDALKNPPVVARLGNISVDENGRGETWWEYRDEDVAETGVPVDRFNVAAVAIEGDKIISPLAGYVGRERFEWKDKIQLNTRSAEVKEELKVEVNEEVPDDTIEDSIVEDNSKEVNDAEALEAIKFKEYEESIRQSDMETIENNVTEEDTYKDNYEETVRADNEPVEDNLDDNEEGNNAEEIEECIPDEAKQDIIPEEYRHEKKKNHASMFHEVLKDFQEVKDISDELKGCRWWKVPYGYDICPASNKHYPYFCAVSHLKMTYPYINYMKYFKKTGYYYFGIKYDKSDEVKYIMYGIEGMNTLNDQPYMGMTGFAKWIRLKNKKCGMWLMYYNPYTGCVMIPKPKKK